MFNSWVFWLILLLIAFSMGVFLTWLEKKSSRKALVGQPSKYPTELIIALKDYFATQDNVKAAYLAHIYDGTKGESPHSIIGIEVTDGFHRIQQESGIIVRRLLKDKEFVDCIPIGSDSVSEYMTTQTEPFYKKSE